MVKPLIITWSASHSLASEVSAAVGNVFGICPIDSLITTRAILHTSLKDPAVVAGVIEHHCPSDEDDLAAVKTTTAESLKLLESIRATRPAVRRFLAAERYDLTLVVEGLHSGLINSILYRPVTANELRAALRPSISPAILTPPSLAASVY